MAMIDEGSIRAEPVTARMVRLRNRAAVAARDQVLTALGREGFILLGEADLRDLFLRTIDRDIGPHWQIDAIHPLLAVDALDLGKDALLLAAVKAAVWEDGSDAIVSLLGTDGVVELGDTQHLRDLVHATERRFYRVLSHLVLDD